LPAFAHSLSIPGRSKAGPVLLDNLKARQEG